jgi:hypothetical protein
MRESDVYELFKEALNYPDSPALLVRAERSRQRKVETGDGAADQEYLWDFMKKQEISGVLQVHIPGRTSRKAREAMVDIRFAEVNLIPPRKYSADPPIRVWAVYALEQETIPPIPCPVEMESSVLLYKQNHSPSGETAYTRGSHPDGWTYGWTSGQKTGRPPRNANHLEGIGTPGDGG